MRLKKTLVSTIFYLSLAGINTQAIAQQSLFPAAPAAVETDSPTEKPLSAYEILKDRQVQEYLKTLNPGFPSNNQLETGPRTNPILPLFSIPESLELKKGKFTESLTVLGKSSLGSVTTSGPLSQDGTLLIDEGNSINVIGGTLMLQNLGLGTIDFLNGRMTLDREGNLIVAGSLNLGGNLSVAGSLNLGGAITAASLKTDIISPLAQSDLRIQLGSPEASPTGFLLPKNRLVIANRKEEERLTIDESGDLATLGKLEGENVVVRNKTSTANLEVKRNLSVGGRAEFETLATRGYLRGEELILDKGIRINTSTARPGREPGSDAAAGQSIFPAGLFSYTIENTSITKSSLVYLTPVGSFEGQPLFVRNILPGRSFTVGLDHPLATPVGFNWLIIN